MPLPFPKINVNPINVYVSFNVKREKIDCERITSLLNLSPTKTTLRDQPNPNQIFENQVDEESWVLSSEQEVRSTDLHTHLSWLLNKLDGKAEIVRLLREEGYRIVTAIYCLSDSENTELTISRQVIHALSALELSLWFDFYHDDGNEYEDYDSESDDISDEEADEQK